MADHAQFASPLALYEKLEQVYRQLNGRVSSRCVGSGQGRVLQLLCDADGMTQAEIASALGVSASTASELTDKLLAAGHISRSKAEKDKRRLLIYITDSGREAADAFRQSSQDALRDAFAVLSSDAQAQLLALLTAILEQTPPEGCAVCSAEDDMIRPGKRI